MAVIGELLVNLRAHTAAFAGDMKKASRLAFGSSKEISRSMKMIGAAALAGAGVAAGALLAIAKRTADYGKEISLASQKTGIAVEDLQRLRYAFEQSNVGAESLQKGLQILNKTLSGLTSSVEAERAINALGITTRDTNDRLLSGKELILNLADAFHKAGDSGEKLAIASTALGKSGAEWIPVLNLGREGIQTLMNQADDLAIVLSQNDVIAAAQLADQITVLEKQMKGLEFVIGKTVVPTLVEMAIQAAALAQVGLPSMGQAVRDLAAGFVYLHSIANPITGTLFLFSKDYRQKIKEITLEIAGGKKQTEDLTQSILDMRRALTLAGAQGETPTIDLGTTGGFKGFTDQDFLRLRLRMRGQAEEVGRELAAATRVFQAAPELQGFRTQLDLVVEALEKTGGMIKKAEIPQMPELWREMTRAMGPAKDTFYEMARGAEEWGRAMESAFTQLILHGASFRETLRGLVLMMAEMVLKAYLFKSIAGIFEGQKGIGGLIGAFFGGLSGKQFGGPVMAGHPYVVGERGPEVFVPQSSGAILSSAKAAGMVINIDARGAKGGTEAEVHRALSAWEQRILGLARVQQQQSALRSV